MKPKRPTRSLDGVLLLDKAAGASSNAVLQRVKYLYQAARAGHTGTLDPLATGLLPVCFGEATKFSFGLLDADKEYEALARLGERTTTGDTEGEVTVRAEVKVSRRDAELVLARFRGRISQIPPMYSALKRGGRPLYEYARAGQDVERAPREVTIHHLELVEFEGSDLRFRVRCSKGTYVRTLAEDIGAALGCGAHLRTLRRTAVGPFNLSQALTLEYLEGMTSAERDAALLPADSLLGRFDVITLDADCARQFLQGQALQREAPAGRLARIYAESGRFLGVGECGPDATLRPKRLISL